MEYHSWVHKKCSGISGKLKIILIFIARDVWRDMWSVEQMDILKINGGDDDPTARIQLFKVDSDADLTGNVSMIDKSRVGIERGTSDLQTC